MSSLRFWIKQIFENLLFFPCLEEKQRGVAMGHSIARRDHARGENDPNDRW